MKKLLYILLPLLMVSASCTKTEEAPSVKILNGSAIHSSPAVTGEGGAFTLLFTSTASWMAYSDNADWITLEPSEGEAGSIQMKVITAPNPQPLERSGNIIISSGDVSEQLTLTQSGSNVEESIDRDHFEIERAGENIKINFISVYGEPEVLIDNEWILLDGIVTDKCLYAISLAVSENKTAEARNGKITVVSKSGTKYEVTVTQDAPYFELIQDEFYLDKIEYRLSVIYKTNTNVGISGLEDWIVLKEIKENGDDKTAVFDIAENTDQERTASVRFLPELLSERTVSITQFADLFLPASQTVRIGAIGGPFSLNILANIQNYTLISCPEWVSVESSRAIENMSIRMIAEENLSTNPRSGYVRIQPEGLEEVSIKLEQDAYQSGYDWQDRDFYKQSLIVKFTGDWCPNCPNMSKAIEYCQEEHPDRLLTYSVYENSSDLLNYKSTGLSVKYDITSYPTGVLDGRAYIENYPYKYTKDVIYEVVQESKEKYPPLFNADVSTRVEENRIKVESTVFCKEPGEYKVAIALLEYGIVAKQSGVDTPYTHNHILRRFFTEEFGDELVFNHPGIQYLYYDMIIPDNVQNVENCTVLISFIRETDQNETDVVCSFVVDGETRTIEVQPTATHDFVDNVIEVSVGDQHLAKFEN